MSRIYKIWFLLERNIVLKGNITIIKKPIINIENNCSLEIGDNVKLNSDNSKYHVNMFAPIKIYIYGDNAKIKIGSNTRIHGSCLNATNSIEIGENCLIAANCQIFDNSGHDINQKNMLTISRKSKKVIIKDNVWIGTGVVILPGTIIKAGSVVAAGSVVRGTYEENSLIAGNPAKFIKFIEKIDNNE